MPDTEVKATAETEDTGAESVVKIPNMVVDFGNGQTVLFIFDGKVYKGASRAVHPEFNKMLIEESGEVWTEQMANAYARNLQTVSYYEAIDILMAADKTFKEAVEFLTV